MCVEELEVRVPNLWDKFLDAYLWIVDGICKIFERVQKESDNVDLTHPLVEPNSRMLVRVTTGALFVVFAIVLCSCAQSRREMSPSLPRGENQASGQQLNRKPSNAPMRSPATSQGDYLYSKRETVIIKRKETGSSTGSMWADARQSRDLFSEDRPQRVGDVVTISIPDDLRYAAPAAGAATAAAPAPAPTSLGGEKAASADAAPAPGVGTGEPVKDFRMEIVAVESSGDIYLRGVREYKNQNGRRMIAVNAKIPRRLVRAGTVDARELTAVTVNEDADGIVADYQAPGWDKIVSRKISGFVPDVNSELASVEDARKELETNREALRQQTQALQDERARLLKDRVRMAKAAEGMNLQETQDAKAADAGAGKDAGKASAKGDSKQAASAKADAKSDPKADAKASGNAKDAKSGKAVGGTTP